MMVDFIFWNIVILFLVYLITKSKDFTVIAVSYLITLWVTLTWPATQSYEVQGRVMNTTEYVNGANQTIVEYSREVYTIPQNFLDFSYVVFIAVLTLYTARKIVLTDLGKRMKSSLKEWY